MGLDRLGPLGAGLLGAAILMAGAWRPHDQQRTSAAPPVRLSAGAAAPGNDARSPTTAPAIHPLGPQLHVAGLHNVHELTPRIYSGSAPENDADFAALAALGIKTVISVDGTRPAVNLAAKHGLRYVHLPFGYNGVPRERQLEIGRAVRDLPGPFYIHCHHGQHRGPTGAVVAAMTVDGWTPEQAIATLRAIGTSPHYKGLYEAARRFTCATNAELDRADNSFPAVARLDDLSSAMVEIDHHWDALKACQKVGWSTPREHPDVDPPHEALLLSELLREAHRPGGAASGRPADLLQRLAGAKQQADSLEHALRRADRAAADRAAQSLDQACTACHERYRDPALNVRP